jgi:ABC-type nitrate/sulfonate/bicarbonate transport system substrate-binding protein
MTPSPLISRTAGQSKPVNPKPTEVQMALSKAVSPTISRRALLRGVAASTAGLGLAQLVEAFPGTGIANAATSRAATQLTNLPLQLSWLEDVSFAGTYIAIDRGYYAAAHLRVDLIPGGPNVVTPPIVATGKALVGEASVDVVASARNGGAPLKIIGARFQKNPLCILSLARKPLRTPQDLVGATVGVNPTNDSTFDVFLALNGIKKSSVKIVPVQFSDTPLTDHSVDGYLGYSTEDAPTLQAQGFDPIVMLLADHGFALYENVYITTDTAIREQREAIVGFLAAERKGWRDNINDPALGLSLALHKYGTNLGLNAKIETLENAAQNKLITGPATTANGLFWMTPLGIAGNVKTLEKVGIKATAADLFDNSLLADANKLHV